MWLWAPNHCLYFPFTVVVYAAKNQGKSPPNKLSGIKVYLYIVVSWSKLLTWPLQYMYAVRNVQSWGDISFSEGEGLFVAFIKVFVLERWFDAVTTLAPSPSRSVRELLFAGYEDPILDLAAMFGADQSSDLPMDKFGWFYKVRRGKEVWTRFKK